MEPGPLIGRGRSADVYAWDEGRVIKLFHPGRTAQGVSAEAEATRAAHDAGLPVPAVGDIVEVGERLGIVYEHVHGAAMLRRMPSRPWRLFRWARMLAELQAAVHEASADALPDQRQWLAWRIKRAARLPEELRHAALRRLRELPAGRAFCHGDLHPDNILLSPGGPVIIDWDGSSQGDPLGDVAATSLMIRTGRPTPAVRRSWLLDAFRTAFHAAYMRHYSRLRPAAEAEVAA